MMGVGCGALGEGGGGRASKDGESRAAGTTRRITNTVLRARVCSCTRYIVWILKGNANAFLRNEDILSGPQNLKGVFEN